MGGAAREIGAGGRPAGAPGPGTIPDRILLEGLTFYGYHGVHPEERVLGQRFVVDLALSVDLGPAGRSDDLAQTVNYSTVYRIVQRVVEGPACNLVEALAERIARAVLGEAGGLAIQVRVAKPWAPVKGATAGTVAVEIYRRAADLLP